MICAYALSPGFESSALNGEGLGIDTFQPQKASVQLSNKMFLPEEALERLRAQARLLTYGLCCVVPCFSRSLCSGLIVGFLCVPLQGGVKILCGHHLVCTQAVGA